MKHCKVLVFLLLVLSAGFIASCADVSGSSGSKGAVALVLDGNVAKKAAFNTLQKSLDYSESDDYSETLTLSLEVSLNGGYSASKTVSFTFSQEQEYWPSQTVVFDNIPVGKSVYAKLKASMVYGDQENSSPLYIGKSDAITVQSGENSLALTAYYYYTTIPYTFTINFDSAPNLDSVGMQMILACDPDSSLISALSSADNLSIYEALKNYSYEDVFASRALDDDCWELNDKTLTVSDIDLWLPVSEEDPGSKAADVIFVYFAGRYNDTLETRYFGIADASQSPVKSAAASASFSASSLGVVDTSYLLYSKGLDVYNYYLASNPDESVSDATMSTSANNSFCFDANGFVYALFTEYSTTQIKSNNQNFGDDGVFDCVGSAGGAMELCAIACDVKTNTLYALSDSDSACVLYSTGSLLDGGDNAQIAYQLNLDNEQFADRNINSGFFAVYDGVAYFVVGPLGDSGPSVVKADLSKAQAPSGGSGIENYDVALEKLADIELPDDVDSDGYEITDMLYQDGAVYALEREVCNNMDSDYSIGVYYKSRGALVRIDASTGTQKTLGWTSAAQNNSSAGFYGYYKSSASASTQYFNYFIGGSTAPSSYDDESKWLRIPGSSTIALTDDSTLVKDVLPNLYSPSTSAASSAFYGPQKFIGIKPKKLVIADDGVAFYTDANGGYRAKNANRVVTVDLEAFAISSCVDSDVSFDWTLESSVYSSAYGNVNKYVAGGLATDLWINNGSHFNSESGDDNSVYLGIPLED